MKYNARIGNVYHAFKKREAFIIRKLDGPKRPTRHDNDRPTILQHNHINTTGRVWSF